MQVQLARDGSEATAAIVERIGRLGVDRDDVQQHARSLEVGEELVPQPDAVRGTLEQPRDVRHRELAVIVELDRAELWRERRERVVGDLRPGVRDPPDERRLAGIREAEQRGVADHLEAQLDLALLAILPHLRGAWRLTRRRGELAVPASAASAVRDDDARSRMRQVGDRRIVAELEDLRAHGHADDRVRAGLAGLVRALAVPAAVALQIALEAEGGEVAQVGVGEQHDVAPVAAVTAVRPALGDELLAPERHASVAAAAALHDDAGTIVEVSGYPHECSARPSGEATPRLRR